MTFVAVSNGLYVNLDKIDNIELGVDKQTREVLTGEKTALILWADGKPFISRGVFALGVLKAIGAEVHILLSDTTKSG